MELFKEGSRLAGLQIFIWLSALLLIFFSILPMDGYTKSFIYTIVNTAFYALIIYGNILFLYPVFYQRGKLFWYVLLVMLFIAVTGILRGYLSITLYNHFLQGETRIIRLGALMYYIPAGILIYMLSLIFRIAIAYFAIKQNAEEMMVQKSRAELDLLKSQVQPHFLFNTLNNIYYEAYIEAPRTAGLIERLSDIMRYFVDESPKELVAIITEVQFIENYISLEKIRIRHGAEINFKMEFDPALRIPPMLLMTFVENIFKHGIDKSSTQNKIDISLTQQDGYLFFKTINNIFDTVSAKQANGFGISNLRKRLSLLYHSDFELSLYGDEKTFTAFLKIPAS
jgi:LytS/YehU family sensor histidine kinase